MKENRSKYLMKNTLIFTIGNLGSKFISFFLIPLYTGALSTAEYGVTDLINTISMILGPILTLNVAESVMRFALDKDADHEKISSIGVFVFISSIVLALVTIPICLRIKNISKYAIYIYLYMISYMASQLFLSDLRGKELLVQYSVGNILLTSATAIFNILFLLIFKMGIFGYLNAYIISNFITALYACVVGKSYKCIFKLNNIDYGLLKSMLKFSVVLIPNSFMWWIMNASDRIMVTSLISVAANGVYAISYKLPTLVSTITAIFNQAWNYSAIKEEGSKDEESYSNEILKTLIVFVITFGLFLIVIIKPFLKIYVSNSYYSAWKYTPFLIVGYVYLTISTFMATSYSVHKDSLGYLISATIGALLNIILNFVLIPIIGVYGAATATCLSYIVVFIYRFFDTKKYLKYNLKIKEFIIGSIFLILSSVILYFDGLVSQVFEILIFILLLIIYKKTIMQITKKVLNNFKIKRLLKWKKKN